MCGTVPAHHKVVGLNPIFVFIHVQFVWVSSCLEMDCPSVWGAPRLMPRASWHRLCTHGDPPLVNGYGRWRIIHSHLCHVAG